MPINASDILATTLPQIDKGLADNIAESNPLLKHMKKNNKIKRIPGGYELTENMLVKPNKNGSWFKGAGYLRTGNNDQMITAHFDWKNYNINVAITGEDEMKNGDSEWRIRNMLEDKLNATKETATNEVSVAMFTNRGVDAAEQHLQLTPLEEIVSKESPVPDTKYTALLRSFSTLAGITPDQNGLDDAEKGLFWCNYVKTGVQVADLLKTMEFMYMALSRNNQKPDIIVCDPEMYFTFQDLMFQHQHFVETNAGDSRIGDPSFTSVRYKGIPVFFDNNCTLRTMYMLNTNYLFFKVHTQRFFNYEPEKKAPAQDVKLFPLYFMGNLTCSGRQFQGRIELVSPKA